MVTTRRLNRLRLLGRLAALGAFCCIAGPGVSANALNDCFTDGAAQPIEACSELIETPGLDSTAKSLAYAMRALAYSRKGAFDQALPDYDMAIRLDPASAVALNNRAWVRLKLGRAAEALADVERSLRLAPGSPHAHDTRAHVRQHVGKPHEALADYERAMRLGGEDIVKLYQCGLAAQGLYSGPVDGHYTPEIRDALKICIGRRECDPLPPSEDCQRLTS